MTHKYQWGKRPDDYQPPDPPPSLRLEPERVGNRVAVPHEAVVLARARAAALAVETAGLLGGLLDAGVPRRVVNIRLDPRLGDRL
jgi:hypothetical protein